MSEHRHLAKITDTFLGWEDHGIFTAIISVDYEHSGGSQGIGVHCLGSDSQGYDLAGSYIAGVMQAVGVHAWESVKGQLIYVLSPHELRIGSSGSDIIGFEGVSFRGAARRFVFAEWQGRIEVAAS